MHPRGVSTAAASDAARETMRGHLLLEPGRLALRELPRPEPDPGGVVVRVHTALTCGTDIKTWLRGHPKFPTPTLFGHEFAGEIAAVGAGVSGLREGDAVMAVPTAPCGRCYFCARAQENLCGRVMDDFVLGAFAEYVKLPAAVVRTNLFPKPAGLSFAEAALLEPLACVVHGLTHVRLRPDDTVLLVGAGAIALLHLLVLRARGVPQVVVVARNPARAAQAQALGAAAVITSDAEGARAPLLALTEGRGADVVIECTGQVGVWEASPLLARRGGQVVLFGGCADGSVVRLDTTRLHYDQVAVASPFHFTPRDVRAAYELLRGGCLGAAALIGAELPLERLGEALERHRLGEAAKFAIRPEAR